MSDIMDFLKSLIIVSEKAANIARLCRQDPHLFQLLIEKKSSDEANPRFVDDFKTLADVLIQELVKYEIVNKFPQLRNSIKGEETNTFSNKLGETIKVEIKSNVEETSSLLQKVLNDDQQAANLLATEVHRKVFLEEVQMNKIPNEDDNFEVELENLGIWIDPIDSTAEYINGVEEIAINGISISGLKCVTVLIGAYDKNTGMPIVGVINQPFVQNLNQKWTGTCFWGTPISSSVSSLDFSPTNTICVSSSEDTTVITRLKDKGYNITEASGAGYKILTVLTGFADAYILTRNSTFKWDTCAPQAILRSLSGDVIVYNEAMKKHIITVKYSEGKCNEGGIIAYRKEELLNEIIECLTS